MARGLNDSPLFDVQSYAISVLPCEVSCQPEGGILAASNGHLLMTFDPTRNKWVSVNQTRAGFGSNNNITNNYIRESGRVVSGDTGYLLEHDMVITMIAVTIRDVLATGTTIEIRRNDLTTPIATLLIAAGERFAYGATYNTDVDEGDQLQCYANGETIRHPVVWLDMAVRGPSCAEV